MKQFFKTLFTNVLSFVIAFFVFIIIGVIFLSVIIGSLSSSDKKEKVKENTVLMIDLKNGIVERGSNNPMEDFDFSSFSSKKSLGLNQILEALKNAKEDENIVGIYMDMTSIPAGMATLEEFRNGLLDFKSSGKWIVSYSEYYSQISYYLASVADEIYVYPEGGVEFSGLRTELAFFKGALDKLEVEAQIIRGRNNKFKSAVEPFMYDKMSDANREQIETFIGSFWNHMLAQISAIRGIEVAQLNVIADSLLLQSSDDALKYKFVDKIVYKDELMTILSEKLNIEDEDKMNTMTLGKYADAGRSNKKIDVKKIGKKDKIAVVYAVGSIESGEGDSETIGSERISKAIREARKDSSVKAVVLRVNSPGGSALASDVIWREVVLTKESKPVVVSMGDVAASGGYYISCAANKIYADPTTVTGSIGVFGMLPNMKNFFNNKLGITFDVAKTNAHADMGTFSRKLDDYEFLKIQESVEQIYDDFIGKVAQGRNMTKEQVDEIGQGRVWSGIDALRLGLVDELGGIEKAVAEAALLANLTDYKTVDYPKQKDPFEEILASFSVETETYFAKKTLGQNYGLYKQVMNIQKMEGVQARIPFAFEIK
jgi:protease IV